MLVLSIIMALVWMTAVILAMNSNLAIVRMRRLVIAIEASCVLAVSSTSGWSGKILILILMQFVAIFVFLMGLYAAAADGEFDRKAEGTELMIVNYPRTINNLARTDRDTADRYASVFLWLSIIFGIALVVLRYVLIFPDYRDGSGWFFAAITLLTATIMIATKTPAEIERDKDLSDLAEYIMIAMLLAPLAAGIVVALTHLSSYIAYDAIDTDTERAEVGMMEATYWLRPVDECAYFDPDSQVLRNGEYYSVENYDDNSTYYLITGYMYNGGREHDVYYYFSSNDAGLQYINQYQANLWFDDGVAPKIIKREKCYTGNLSGKLYVDSTEYDVYIPDESYILQ